MGYWGVKSYEDDDADDAIDAGYDRVHGQAYEELMDDRSPLPYEQVLRKLASPQTLEAALQFLAEQFENRPLDDWTEEERVSYCGVVVRHAEFGVVPPEEIRDRAIQWLETEDLEWDEDDAAARTSRRRQEIAALKGK